MVNESQQLPEACFVYGAGGFGRRLAESLQVAGVKVRGIIDRTFQESLEERFAPSDPQIQGSVVVLGINNPETVLQPILSGLSATGASKVLSPVQAVLALARRGVILDNYWMTGNSEVYENAVQDIGRARELLGDGKSLSTFDQTLQYRQFGAIESSPKPDPAHEIYSPNDVPFLSPGMRFLDVGAFDGDTLRAMLRWNPRPTEVLALEPDPTNFRQLADVTRSSAISAAALPLGVGQSTGFVRFRTTASASASVDAEGDTVVGLVSIDDLCSGWKPTHIKMDIEGMEPHALLGAKGVIREHAPNLAISVYHSPEHHWSLLLQINELQPDYRFFLRTYGQQTFDTVLYCTTEGS